MGMDKVYEVHGLEDKKLPIIFHYDEIQRRNPTGANWHDNIEILYCVKGSGQVICNSAWYDMKAEDIIIINSNEIHAFCSKEQVGYYCLIVDSAFLKENALDVAEIEFETKLHSEKAGGLFEMLATEIQAEGRYQVAAVRTAALQLVLHLAREHSHAVSEQGKNQSASGEYMKKAIRYMKANYREPMTLEEIAEHVGLSKYYFAREFKKATGMTVISFLNVIRCRNAKKLLQKKECSVREAAYLCGFENDSYFARCFKKYMGVLPSKV